MRGHRCVMSRLWCRLSGVVGRTSELHGEVQHMERRVSECRLFYLQALMSKHIAFECSMREQYSQSF